MAARRTPAAAMTDTTRSSGARPAGAKRDLHYHHVYRASSDKEAIRPDEPAIASSQPKQ